MSTPSQQSGVPQPNGQPWVSFTPGKAGAAGPCPSLMDLAQYIDGRADPDMRHAFEQHIAACAMCTLACDDIRQSTMDGGESAMVFVPPSVLDRAMALVSSSSKHTIETGSPAFGLNLSGRRSAGWVIMVRRGVAVAASLLICALGYRIGATISSPSPTSQAIPNSETAESSIGTLMSFGVLDSSDESAQYLEIFTTQETG